MLLSPVIFGCLDARERELCFVKLRDGQCHFLICEIVVRILQPEIKVVPTPYTICIFKESQYFRERIFLPDNNLTSLLDVSR